MKKFTNIFLVFIFVFINLYGNTTDQALSYIKISMVPDKVSVVEDEELNIQTIFSCEENTNISAFRMRISFDSSKFFYKGLYSPYSTSDFKTSEKTNLLTVLYVTNERGVKLDANSSTCLFELNFKATSDSSIGDSTFSAAADGVCNYDCTALPCVYIDSINISKINSEPANCNLSSLTAVDCILSPNFSPNITKYVTNVPYSKSSINIIATAEDPTASVKVSRKTLNAAGKSTDINITVMSSDKQSKQVYTVTVNRGTKDSSSTSKSSTKSSNSTKKSSQSPGKSSSSKNKSANSLSENVTSTDSPNNAALVVKENNFNFPLFFTVSLAIVFILILMLKKRKKSNK